MILISFLIGIMVGCLIGTLMAGLLRMISSPPAPAKLTGESGTDLSTCCDELAV